MASFAEKFASKKNSGSNNSKQHQMILAEMQQMQEDLAVPVSEANSSVSNVESILARGSKSSASETKSSEEILIEQELEEHSLEKLLKAIERTTSPEELSALMQQYEALLASWNSRASLLRSDKYLKEYLSIQAALSMLQKMMQNPDLLFSGRQTTDLLQTNLLLQRQNINEQAQKMQAQNQKLHEQTQSMMKQLSQTEKSLQATIEALKKDPGKLSPEAFQSVLKQLQESLRQIQSLKERIESGKTLNFREVFESLQKIHAQNQKIIESGKLSQTVLQAMKQSQLSLEQTLLQTNLVQQLQKNISALQATHLQHINHSLLTVSSHLNQREYIKYSSISEPSVADRPLNLLERFQRADASQNIAIISNHSSPQHMTLRTALPVHMSVGLEIARNSQLQALSARQTDSSQLTFVQKGLTPEHLSNGNRQTAFNPTATQSPDTSGTSLAGKDNVIPITSAMQYQLKQEQSATPHTQTPSTPNNTEHSEERKSTFAELYRRESSTNLDAGDSSKRVCKCSSHLERVEQSKSNAMIIGFS